jgi:hypothetical protein
VTLRIFVLILLTVVAAPALASHGGPEIVEVLGFDPVDRKIFFTTLYQDETDLWPDVHYFDLKSARPWIPVRVDMRKGLDSPTSGAGDWQDPEYTELSNRLMRLRQRLRPIPHAKTLDLTMRTEVLSADSVMMQWSKVPRLHRSVELRDSTHFARVEVTTYCDQRLGIESVLRMPGQAWTLIVMVSRGIPVETCYELESPILLLPTGPPTRKLVSSRPGGPLGLPKP